MSGQLLTIVPPSHEASKPVRTQGTKVLTQDGTEITGVTKITLVADANDIWRATIECVVDVQPMEGIEAEIVRKPEPVSLPPKYSRFADVAGSHPTLCDECGSFLKKGWFGFGRVIGCTDPHCLEYYGHRSRGSNPLPFGSLKPSPTPSLPWRNPSS